MQFGRHGVPYRRIEAGEARLSRIVLETSGLADPGPIVEAIRTDPSGFAEQVRNMGAECRVLAPGEETEI